MKISVELYKRIEYINSQPQYDEVDKLAYIVGEVYGYAPEKVNHIPAYKFRKMVAKINKKINQTKIFYSLPLPILTDATKLTFGQFVDLQHWYKQPEHVNFESIIARLLIGEDLKDLEQNKKKILKTNIQKVLYKYYAFRISYEKLILNNKDLFDINEGESEANEQEQEKEESHPFINSFGWFFVAEQFRDYFHIKLDDVYELPIMECLSALNYLKAKQAYEKEMLKK